MKKVYITKTSSIGLRCHEWAKSLLVDNIQIVENESDCQILLSVFHNKIFTSDFLSKREGCFNFHGGLLPDYRGSCTINWAILNNEKETGVTLHKLETDIDTGDIIDIHKVPLDNNDTSGSVYFKLEAAVFFMFKKWFLKLINEDFKAIPQSQSSKKTYTKNDIESVKDLTKYVRAFQHDGKENAYYYSRSGKKFYLTYE